MTTSVEPAICHCPLAAVAKEGLRTLFCERFVTMTVRVADPSARNSQIVCVTS